MPDLGHHTTEDLQAAKVALSRGAWEQAGDLYSGVVDAAERPEALEGVGAAQWWLGDTGAAFAARQRAYCSYRRGGDTLGAARMALRLGADCCSIRDAHGPARWWLKRAGVLLEHIDLVPEHAWLALCQAQLSLVVGDDADAVDNSARAAELGRSLAVVSIEKLALAHQGVALVMGGNMAGAAAALDDADAPTVAAEADNADLAGAACWGLMAAFEQVKDFDSIRRWGLVVEHIAQPWSSSWVWWACRIQHSAVLVWRGQWDQAERQLQRAVEALENSGPAIGAEALVRLARLRRRQGRHGDTAALLEQAACAPLRLRSEQHAQLAWGELILDQGDATSARRLVEQLLAATASDHCTARLDALALLVSAEIGCGKGEVAHAALGQLQRSACAVATDGVRAGVRLAEGMVAVCVSEFATAVGRLEEAVALFERAGARFDTAKARFELAVAQAGAGHQQAAMREAASAMEALAALGACREAERGQQRLPRPTRARPVGSAPGSDDSSSGAALTSREIEILRLVARARTNLAIAEELSVSVRTVERHLSNIYEKLGASGRSARAAAVAHALRHGLLGPQV